MMMDTNMDNTEEEEIYSEEEEEEEEEEDDDDENTYDSGDDCEYISKKTKILFFS